MQRRDFCKQAGGALLALSACIAGIKTVRAGTEYKWKMVTT